MYFVRLYTELLPHNGHSILLLNIFLTLHQLYFHGFQTMQRSLIFLEQQHRTSLHIYWLKRDVVVHTTAMSGRYIHWIWPCCWIVVNIGIDTCIASCIVVASSSAQNWFQDMKMLYFPKNMFTYMQCRFACQHEVTKKNLFYQSPQ